MPPRQSLINFFNAKDVLLKLNFRNGMLAGAPDHIELSKSTALTLQQQVKAVRKIDPDEANEIMSITLDMNLFDDYKAEVVASINEKILKADGTEDTPAGGLPTPKQECPNPELFLSGDVWDLLQNPSTTSEQRLMAMMMHFVSIGLWYPTETAVKNIVAVVLHDQGGDLITRGLQLNKTFKSSIVMHRNKRVRPRPLPADDAWDASPEEFVGNYPEWVADREIVACQIERERLEILKVDLGCRGTKRGARQHKVPILALQPQPPVHAPGIMPSHAQLQQMWLANQLQQQRQMQDGAADIPIQYFPAHHKQQLALPPGHGAHDLGSLGSQSSDSQDGMQIVAYGGGGSQGLSAQSSPEAPPSARGGWPSRSASGLPSSPQALSSFTGGLPPNSADGLPSRPAAGAQPSGFPGVRR